MKQNFIAQKNGKNNLMIAQKAQKLKAPNAWDHPILDADPSFISSIVTSKYHEPLLTPG